MATKVLVVSAKGGSGRTTATVLLATALGEAGVTSGIIDLDPQASASSWIKASRKPIPGVEVYKKGRDYDFVWTDTQPLVKPTNQTKQAASAANIILLIGSDSPLDLHATNLTVQNLLTSPSLKKKTHLLFTRVLKNTGLSKQLDGNAKLLGVQRLKPVIHFKNCYREAAIMGWSALNRAAKDEIRNVAMVLLAKTSK
jgi:cellulose biosynthesis protein BcsQ